MRVVFNTRANREIRRIAEYYQVEAGPEYADEFFEDLRSTMDRIRLCPRSFPVIEGDFHRAILKRFPFILVYRIVSDALVRIHSVRHQKQNPDLGLIS